MKKTLLLALTLLSACMARDPAAVSNEQRSAIADTLRTMITTAYAILRHNGVPVGKMDFITHLTMQDA